MKKTITMLLAIMAGSSSVWAGVGNGGDVRIPIPDAGTSVLLLGVGLTALGFMRRNSRR